MIKVLADKHLFELEKFIPQAIELHPYDPAEGIPSTISDADALLIRTVTPINRESIASLPESIQFIGSASAGFDHVNTELLDNKNIVFANAAGCNARSVAEYVATALLIWADQQSRSLPELSVGIVGVGNVGSSVRKILGQLNMDCIGYDPPRENRENSFKSCSLEEVLAADILTFHTPLTHTGEYSTHHWLSEEKLNGQSFELILNTARGGVVNEQYLTKLHNKEKVRDFIIDVWENEPLFNDLVAQKAFIKTPHIAGYSIEAKRRASKIIVKELCNHFNINFPEISVSDQKKNIDFPNLDSGNWSIADVLMQIHPIATYQQKMEALLGKVPSKKSKGFNSVRVNLPFRNEFQYLTTSRKLLEAYPVLEKLGIRAE